MQRSFFPEEGFCRGPGGITRGIASREIQRARNEIIAEIGALFVHHALGLVFTAGVIVRGGIKFAILADFGIAAALGAGVPAAVVHRGEFSAAVPAVTAFFLAHKGNISKGPFLFSRIASTIARAEEMTVL